MLFLGLKMNNKNIIELEEIFHNIVKKHNLEIHCGGINNGKIFLEDGLPWVEFYGSFTKVSAKKFLQELSNEMNINIVFNLREIKNSCEVKRIVHIQVNMKQRIFAHWVQFAVESSIILVFQIGRFACP